MAKVTIDRARTLFYVLVENDDSKLLSRMGHDHVVRAERFELEGTLDLDDLAASRIAVRVPVEGLRVDEEHMRRHVGWTGEVSANDRDKTAENMLARDQLWAARHPTIAFVSSAIELGDEPDVLRVRGELTVRGVACAVVVELAMTLDADLFEARGRLAMTHGDFGFKPYRAPLGALKNKDALTFVFEVHGRLG